ncbi:MAG: acyl-CoA/acyl-ACP dehydrogenase [Proteobacteria bacterium]|nr:acyl-CoA/acyl-ACP dehydrogenase [Pseudomonadota bacterium]
MDLDFSTEQKMIMDEALNFLKKECPYSHVKELEETPEGYSPKMWRKMADLGWLGLAFPEAYGGDGGQFMDLVILQEAMGSAVCPSPFFSTVVQCGLLVMDGGTESQKKEFLPRIADGKLIMALAQYEADGSFLPEDIQMRAEPKGDGYLLDGTKLFVADANIAGTLLVAAKTSDDDVTLFLVDGGDPGLSIVKMPTIGKDNTCQVVFQQVTVAKENTIGSLGQGAELLERMNAKASVAKAAEMLGACKACIDMTAGYAKEREQYGKPIGGFQVIQHYLANMLIQHDTNYNYLYKVACMVDEGEDFAIDASALKANVNEAYKFIGERGVQIHGGIGTTREGDVALFYRKAKSSEFVCGDTELHYERVFQKLLERTSA